MPGRYADLAELDHAEPDAAYAVSFRETGSPTMLLSHAGWWY